MKKFIKIFTLLLAFFALTLAIGCDSDEDNVKVESISIVQDSVPSSVTPNEVYDKIDDIKIELKKSNGKTETITITKEMISAADYEKLKSEGTHEITISYEGVETKLTITVENIVDPEAIEYQILVKDIAGKPLSNFYVTIYERRTNNILAEGNTKADGYFTANLLPGIYDVEIEEKEGYYLNENLFQTDKVGSIIEIEAQIYGLAGEVADPDHIYQVGDIMYDFTVTDTEGNELTLYELLEEFDAVVLNFWYTGCTYCVQEFPAIEDAYNSVIGGSDSDIVSPNPEQLYKDKVAIIAINPGNVGNNDAGDSNSDISNFKESYKLTFPFALDYDAIPNNNIKNPGLTTMFGIKAYPTTVIVDRYGLIAEIAEGAVTQIEKWTQTFDEYIASDYEPVYKGEQSGEMIEPVPEDVKREDMNEVANILNGSNYDNTSFTGTYAEEDNESDKIYTWPWWITEKDGIQAIYPSNKGKNPSLATIYLTANLTVGDALVFDYYASCESYDKLYVFVDNVQVCEISGEYSEWKTKYAYIANENREYEFMICYVKDYTDSNGDDAVYLSNIRIEREDTTPEATYILRTAATGAMNEFTMSYENYVTVVYNDADGYYHVGTENGPLLLADMLNGTKWSNVAIYGVAEEGNCVGYDNIDYNELIIDYSVYASNSVVGLTPVTLELANALKQVSKALGDPLALENENQWLELCSYYNAYGTNGKELDTPIVGVAPFEPIYFAGNGINEPATASGDYNRVIVPRGLIFSFTPTQSGVYKYYSTEEQLEAIGWICDETGYVIADTDTELRLYAQMATNGIAVGNNFSAYRYLEAGKEYLFRACYYDIYDYGIIDVAIKYIAPTMELLTAASPGPFTSSDDEMSDIISGNYVDYELKDGYYHVKDSKASDTFLYADFKYLNAITGYDTLEDCIAKKGFDFARDEFGFYVFDENGYQLVTGYTDETETAITQYYICEKNGEQHYVRDINGTGCMDSECTEGAHSVANGFTYLKWSEEELTALKKMDYTQYVTDYLAANMITDETSELYGCVKVDEEFAKVLSMFMDKVTFAGVEGSWLKLCYYYKYLGE